MKRDFYICELAWTPTPDPAAKSCCGAVAPRIISLPYPSTRAFAPKRADPRAPSKTPALAGVVKTPRKEDRKSTRLNSSHLGISYAGFCLEKRQPHASR